MSIKHKRLHADFCVSFSSPTLLVRAAVLAAFIGVLALPSPARAADDETPGTTENAVDQPAMSPQEARGDMGKNPHDMDARVEARIKTLHDKLGITRDQEDRWNVVAQTMRANETEIGKLIQERRDNAATMTAIDDLQSYENITQTHVEGLKKLMPAFQALYNDMSDAQKKKADMVFGASHEGHNKKKHA